MGKKIRIKNSATFDNAGAVLSALKKTNFVYGTSLQSAEVYIFKVGKIF